MGASFTRLGVGAALIALLAGTQARADTLREALARVYASGPTLTGARAGLRALDEGVPIARAPGLPSLSADATYDEFVKRSANSFSSPHRALIATSTLSVPVYSGGGVRNAINAAKSRVDAGRADLRSTEADAFLEATSVYMDVIRDESIVELNGGNVRVLETNLQASRDRFQVGDLTRTDVAQSDARLAGARSQLQSAQAQLDASREGYLRVVGAFPGTLDAPPPLPEFPATTDDAVEIAVASNPSLDAARKSSKAAAYDVRVAEAGRLPKISGFVQGEYDNYFNTLGSGTVGAAFAQTDKTATAGVRLTVPIFQGGLPGAQVRQAQARESQSIEQATATERQVVNDARVAFSRYEAALGVIQSSETAVSANELALEGVRAENSVGTRTILDVLNAEQELLNSRVTLVTARHDAYIAGFQLLVALGKAEAKDLGLDGGPLYDPTINYRRVAHSINDWATDPKPVPVATSTVNVPAPSAVPPPVKSSAQVPAPGGSPMAPPGRTPAPGPAPTEAPLGPPPSVTPPPTPPLAPPRSRRPAPRDRTRRRAEGG